MADRGVVRGAVWGIERNLVPLLERWLGSGCRVGGLAEMQEPGPNLGELMD